MNEKRCHMCAFYVDDGSLVTGECRRLPPRNKTTFIQGRETTSVVFPVVSTDTWCGEFLPSEE